MPFSRSVMPSHRAFIVSHTELAAPDAVPEIRLHLASEVTPLWHSSAEVFEAEGIEPPYWAFAWAGGQALARYLLDEPAVVRDRVVADIGSGSGIVALAAKRSGAMRVVAFDIDPVSLTACTLNAEANELAIEVECRDIVGDALEGYDVVLIGDLFYEEGPAKRIHAWAKELAHAGKVVLVGDPGRAYLPSGLVEVFAREMATSLDLESAASKRVAVYRLG
jgi:predicted nicotinamide N-methyase